MSRKEHASETPATQLLKRRAVVYTEHLYEYVDKGGTAESAERQLAADELGVTHNVVGAEVRHVVGLRLRRAAPSSRSSPRLASLC